MWTRFRSRLKFLFFAILMSGSVATAQNAARLPLYLSLEQRLELTLALEIATGTIEQKKAATLFLADRIEARQQQAQVVNVATFEDFLTAFRGQWPNTQSMSLDLQYLRKQDIPGKRVFLAPDPKIQASINNYINNQPVRLRKQLGQMGVSETVLNKVISMSPSATPIDLIEASRGFYEASIHEASRVAGDFIDTYFKDMSDKALKIVIRTVFTTYYFEIGTDSKKLIASSLLGSDLRADPLSHFLTLIINSGPILQKTLQVVAKKDGIPEEMKAVLSKLEDGARSVPWIQVEEILEANKDAYKFKSVNQRTLGVGSMAQVHLAELLIPLADDNVVVRFIKPGAPERVNEDERVLKEIARRLDANKDYRNTGAPKMSPLVKNITNTVRVELSIPGTIERQKKAGEVYEKTFQAKVGGKNVQFSYHAPHVIESNVPNDLHVQERVRGKKLEVAVSDLPNAGELKRAIAEKTAEMFFKELLLGSGFYHADFHQGNFLVDKISNGKFVINILDYGMGGTLTRQMQEDLLKVSAAISLNKADKIAEIYWNMSEKSENQITREEFYKLVREKAADLKQRRVIWPDDAWISLIVDKGLALPFDLINLNRAILTMAEVLKNGKSKETINTISKKVVMSAPIRLLKILFKGKFSVADVMRLGFTKPEIDRSAGVADPIADNEIKKESPAVSCKAVYQ